MAVYTEVDHATASRFLHGLDAGELLRLEGAAGGIENTNYFVDSTRGAWVLTVFERLDSTQLPFYLGLMRHLAQRGLPVPEPRPDARGEVLHQLAGKPAALVNRLPGVAVDAPDLRHCAALGQMLGRLHWAAQDFPGTQPNPRGLAWWAETAPTVAPYLATEAGALLAQELDFQRRFHAAAATRALPHGPVHADLFRDNVLFEGSDEALRVSGVFDFYFAGIDHHAYDLAVCLNDWCVDDASGRLEETRAQALVAAYHAQRPLSAAEQRALPALRRGAALRFWLSRLADLHLPRPAHLLQAKDPVHFERVLRDCVDNPWHVDLWALPDH